MSVQVCSFLRILRTTALTSFVCFSSSAVYAMDDGDDILDRVLCRTTGSNLYASASALRGITYRTTGSNPDAVHKRSFIFFELEKAGYDPTKLLEININHRTPDEKFSPKIAFFDDSTNKYCPIGKLPESEDFTSTSYFVDLSPLYSYLLTYEKPKVLKLSFISGVSDIHSVTLQQDEMDKKVLQSVVLGDIRSENQPTKLVVTSPERSNSNEWSTSHRVIPRPSFAFSELPSIITSLTPAIVEALLQTGETQMETFKRLIERTDLPFSHRLEIAHSLGERALFTLATDERNKLEDRVSATQYLEGAMKIIADRKMQRLLEGMSNKDPSISALRGITLPEGYNSNEWSKIHCEITMPERLVLKFETHGSNKPIDRVSFTEYLEDLHLDEYLLLNF